MLFLPRAAAHGLDLSFVTHVFLLEAIFDAALLEQVPRLVSPLASVALSPPVRALSPRVIQCVPRGGVARWVETAPENAENTKERFASHPLRVERTDAHRSCRARTVSARAALASWRPCTSLWTTRLRPRKAAPNG